MAPDLLARAVKAHDPLGRFSSVRALRAEVRVGGNILAFRFRSPSARRVTVHVDARRPRLLMTGFPQPGWCGEMAGDVVRIRDDAGRVVGERHHARSVASSRVKWDALDEMHFLGYALWNYALTPFFFTWPGFHTEELPAQDGLQRLRVRFPSGIPTHSAEQVFHFNERNLLVRLDYTAEVFGSRWRGAHFCGEHRELGGFLVPTHRKVLPKLGGRVLPFPAAMEGWVESLGEAEELPAER
ncbi:MAG: hypothetical protein AB2A00_04530 [Myxococcota bacterium]